MNPESCRFNSIFEICRKVTWIVQDYVILKFLRERCAKASKQQIVGLLVLVMLSAILQTVTAETEVEEKLAKFEVKGLSISPSTGYGAENVTVRVEVESVGLQEAEYNVRLLINGTVEAPETALTTTAPDEAQPVLYLAYIAAVMIVASMIGAIILKRKEETIGKWFNPWWLIILYVVGIVLGIVWLILKS